MSTITVSWCKLEVLSRLVPLEGGSMHTSRVKLCRALYNKDSFKTVDALVLFELLRHYRTASIMPPGQHLRLLTTPKFSSVRNQNLPCTCYHFNC